MLRSFAIGRSLGGDQTITRIVLESAVILARPELAERLADAPEPFWQHVRDALLAYRASASWDVDD